jgi:hypothetical protein
VVERRGDGVKGMGIELEIYGDKSGNDEKGLSSGEGRILFPEGTVRNLKSSPEGKT